MTENLLLILFILSLVVSLAAVVLVIGLSRKLDSARQELMRSTQETVGNLGSLLREGQQQSAEAQDRRMAEFSEIQKAGAMMQDRRFAELTAAQKENAALQDRRMAEFTEVQKETAEVQDKRMAAFTESQRENSAAQDKRMAEMNSQVGQRLTEMNRQLTDSSMVQEQKLENIRGTMEKRLMSLQEDNSKKLDQMRETVDEKLQKTLESRITQSFRLVSERLEEVYKGLGEMQNLAAGVGDLKKVLSNVKTRGILGEIQLGAILEEILSPEQYERDICTKSGSTDRVEYAVKLPGDEDGVVYLPIDAKFPADVYSRLVDAYEAGEGDAIAAAGAELERSIRNSGKYIHDKYIDPPGTTDFGILFLPFEGLYAEVVRRGLVETLQRDYKINIAGPTTMAALLNSLQMGFRTLAIQKRSGEVWKVLANVKTEFGKFSDVLQSAQKHINQVGDDLDKLVGTRTRMMMSKLRSVEKLPEQGLFPKQEQLSWGDDITDFFSDGEGDE